MKRRIILLLAVVAVSVASLQVLTSSSPNADAAVLAPSGMTIILTNTSALDYSNPCDYLFHEIKVIFTGCRYSDGQRLTDPACPFIGENVAFSSPYYCLCDNFYYCDGSVSVYTRQGYWAPWVYQGAMMMDVNNCTIESSRVTYFTVNCQYLTCPE